MAVKTCPEEAISNCKHRGIACLLASYSAHWRILIAFCISAIFVGCVTMATVSQMRNGSWFVDWPINLSNNAQTNFVCDKMAFKLAASYANNNVTLALAQESKSQTLGILLVTAAYNGQTREMARSSVRWGPVSWNYAPNSHKPAAPASTQRNIHRSSNASNSSKQLLSALMMLPIAAAPPDHSNKFITFQLIIEFNRKNKTTKTEKTTISDGEQQVLTHLSNLLDTQKMADISFVVKGEIIRAHSAIVVSASPVMAAMFQNDLQERRTSSVEINDIEPSVFKEMLRYLYTGTAPKLHMKEMTEPLFLAADKYQIEHLKKLCEQHLIKKIALNNVVHHLVIAHLHLAPALFEASLKFLERNKREVWTRPEWEQLVNSYPQIFYMACKRMMVWEAHFSSSEEE